MSRFEPLTEQEREIIEAAGCSWVLARIARALRGQEILLERITHLEMKQMKTEDDINFELDLLADRNALEQRLRQAQAYILQLKHRIMDLEKQLKAEEDDEP